MISVNVSVKKKKHRICEGYYAWNSRICACDCDKDCDVGEYLKNCTCTEDDLVVKCDIVDMPVTTSINSNGKTNSGFIAIALLATTCLLLLIVITKYYLKCGLTVPCLLSH